MPDTFLEISAQNIEQFIPLFVGVFNAPPWSDGWTFNSAQERLRAFAQFPQFKGLGFIQNGEPVALILGWGERWVDGWVFHVKEMCVAKDLQGEGIGTNLLAEFEQQLKALGYVNIYLQTGTSAPARAFYEKAAYGLDDYVALSKDLNRLRTRVAS